MHSKEKIVISRKWNNPEIRTFANVEEVGSEMDFVAFIDALVEEVGNPTTTVTKAGLKAKLVAAAEAVFREMKEQTKRVV